MLDSSEATLLDIVDNVLSKGVVLSGDLTIALAQVDLVYARLSLLLCAADRVLPSEDTDLIERHHHRRQKRVSRLRHVGSQRHPTPSSTASRSAVADRPAGKARG